MKARKSCHSFTLIEMLVVIAIIGVLTGMIFRMMSNANRQREKAVCVTIIEKVAMALNEFKAEYGQYPPGGNGTRNWYPNSKMPDLLKTNYFGKYESTGETLFKYCYLSYLLPRYDDPAYAKNKQRIPDTDRDAAAKARWASFLDGIVYRNQETNFFAQGINYGLGYETIQDAWGRELQYQCTAPYQVYDLYSVGPDGVAGTADDMHKTQKWDD